ncbi:double-stranded RNA-binding protein 2 [Prunus yedoensis var. nudiflora]|uniref:Double-stranded RNA-binding protein 2 n=1 Tax=Prunus yedoensis var. nudiflora TaxID=2094558 RepID=A0A314Y7J6_PRUYE|nr:double-stranded RNA-binding protein 2 [Prunus yedoensis var. nudiflora]
MYKNQLQELAQRSCFNLPSYTCIREGPDHAPRFKATVNFNGEIFESPHYCSTLRQAEHSAAEVALNYLSNRGPSHSLAARILDETGVYKNLLQEIAQRVGAPLPQYTTLGEPAKNKKQAEKNAAMAAWSSLKQLAKETASSSSEPENNDELEQITIARALLTYRSKEKMANPTAPILFPKKFPVHNPRPTSPQPPSAHTSKILPLICQKQAPRSRLQSNATNDNRIPSSQPSPIESRVLRPNRFPAAGAAPYVPIRQLRTPCHGIAPPVTIRTAVPVFSAPPRPPPPVMSCQAMRVPPLRVAPPVTMRQAVPVFSAPPIRKDDPPTTQKEDPPIIVKEDLPVIRKFDPPAVIAPSPQNDLIAQVEETGSASSNSLQESKTVQSLEQLKI